MHRVLALKGRPFQNRRGGQLPQTGNGWRLNSPMIGVDMRAHGSSKVETANDRVLQMGKTAKESP